MHRFVIVPLLFLLSVQDASGQTVRCQLARAVWDYVLRGVCLTDPQEPRGEGDQASFWPSDSIKILMTTGPWDAPPWRGNISLPRLEMAFELVRENPAPARTRLVLRTAFFWLLVKEWRETDPGSALLVFGLNDSPPASADDIAVLNVTLSSLDSIVDWDRDDDRDCTNDDPGAVSLFCLLSGAIGARMGRYHHRQPALQVLRAVIVERWPERMKGHPLMDFNNHPSTTMDDLRTALQVALGLAREQATSER